MCWGGGMGSSRCPEQAEIFFYAAFEKFPCQTTQITQKLPIDFAKAVDLK